MKQISTLLAILVLSLLPLNFASARAGLVTSQGIWLSKEKVFAGDTVKIYTIVNNDTFGILNADVNFYVNGTLVGTTHFNDLPKELAKQLWVQHTFAKGAAHITVSLTNISGLNEDGSEIAIPSDAQITKEVSADFNIDVDTDGDGVGDREDTDDDNDGLSDEQELNHGTNPMNTDTDGDGLSDNDEVQNGTSPTNTDTDGDGVSDGQEQVNGTNPKKSDTDGDGVNDGQEASNGTNPTVKDTDRDGLSDGQEADSNTNPLKADSDDDTINDGDELRDGTNPVKKDTDGDGLIDSQEKLLKTNPKVKDTDGDGVSDGDERKKGSDPLTAPTAEAVVSTTVTTTLAEESNANSATFAGQVKGEKEFAPGNALSGSPFMKWPFIIGSVFSFFLFLIFYGVYLQKQKEREE